MQRKMKSALAVNVIVKIIKGSCLITVEQKGAFIADAHDWVNGVCQNGCNTVCAGHIWDNSVCTYCKLVCADHA